MTKYRCLWHKSTTNHYILYFVHVLGLNSPNKGHCLWKARTSLAGRGFGRAILPLNPLQLSGRASQFATVRRPGQWSRLEMRFGRERLLVQDTHNQYIARIRNVKNNVLPALKPVQSRIN
jgi:hypothetical protein